MASFADPLPTLFARSREDRMARKPGGGKPGLVRDIALEAAAWRLTACSRPELEHPLVARLTEFWFNHFNVSASKGSVRPFVGHYQLTAIRPHVLGKFEDMVLATARHPAMLMYLDQAQSVGEKPMPANPLGAPTDAEKKRRGLNENYARELMELHTLGVNGGYTQADVRALARMLTGWTVDPKSPTGFRFAAGQHDTTPKTFLGHAVSATGEAEGVEAIRRLARHPATAQRVALRLAQWFVADEPDPVLVKRMADRFLHTQGDLMAVMTVLADSTETWERQVRLFKTPMDYACSALAMLPRPAPLPLLRQAHQFLKASGQPLNEWSTPDGYKTDAKTWLSPEALTLRADLAMAVGRHAPDPQRLWPWLHASTQERLKQEPMAQRMGLALASPEFMHK